MDYKIKKRIITAEKALEKLELQCSRSEKCSGDIRKLLYRWEISQSDSKKIIASLIKDKYIDDNRYVAAYVRDKSRFSGWGVRKIEQSLLQKGMDREIVQNNLQDIVSKEDMTEKLHLLLNNKLKEVIKKESNSYKIKDKLFRFAASRGFEFEMISSTIEKLDIDEEY